MMKGKAKSNKSNARLAAIKTVEAAAHKLEEASDRYDEAYQAFMQAAREKKEAEEALRSTLAGVRQAQKRRS